MTCVSARTMFMHERYFSHIHDRLRIIFNNGLTAIPAKYNNDVFSIVYDSVESIKSRIHKYGQCSVFQCYKMQPVFRLLTAIINKLNKTNIDMQNEYINKNVVILNKYLAEFFKDIQDTSHQV